jgi:hypothetical protein
MTFCHASWANSNTFTPTEDELFQGNLGTLYSTADRFVTATFPYEIIGVSNTKSSIEYIDYTLDSLGNFTFKGKTNMHDTVYFDWNATAADSTIINGTVRLDISPVNDAPQISILDADFDPVPNSNLLTITENEPLIGYIEVLDLDQDVVDLSLDSSLPDSDQFLIDTPITSGGDTFYPLKSKIAYGFDYESPNQAGPTANSYQIKILADDNNVSNATDEEILDVIIANENEPPQLSGSSSYSETIIEDANSSTDLGSWFSIHGNNFPSFSATDPDAIDSTLDWSFHPAPQSGKGNAYFSTSDSMTNPSDELVEVPNQSPVYLNFIPDANVTGQVTFSVRVTDDVGNFDEIDFTVEIDGVDDPPVFTSEVSSSDNPIIIPSGSLDSFLVLGAKDDDDSSATFTYSIVEELSDDNSHFTVSSGDQVTPNSGIISANPDSADGLYRFQVKATENNGEVVYQSVYVEINEPPYFKDKDGNKVVDPIEVIISEDESPISWDSKWSAEVAGLSAYDPGVSGEPDSLISINSWSIDPSSSNGTVELKSDGSIDYEPDSDFSGSDTFTISATDR